MRLKQPGDRQAPASCSSVLRSGIWKSITPGNQSYLPMQKLEKMRFRMSSAVVAPVS